MGEFADMEIERSLNDHLDYQTGSGFYSDDNQDNDFLDDWEGEDIVIHRDSFKVFHVKEQIRTTKKSWLLLLEEDNKAHWFSKKFCRNSGDKVIAPSWLIELIFA